MTVEKPIKQLLRPITSGAGSAMNQSQFLAIICHSLEAREKSRVRGAIGFAFDSHWLKNWSFKPITKRSNRSESRNYFRQSFENCSNDKDDDDKDNNSDCDSDDDDDDNDNDGDNNFPISGHI